MLAMSGGQPNRWRLSWRLMIMISMDPISLQQMAARPLYPSSLRKGSSIVVQRPSHAHNFPLVVAFAVTIHKAQGMTVDRAVLDISRSDFALGLSYVAVSRVRNLGGIMFEKAS